MTSKPRASAPEHPFVAERKRLEAEVGPRPDELAEPVGWMLSPELVANLKSILRRFSDPRRWMRLDAGRTHVEDGSADAGRWAPITAAPAPAPAVVDRGDTATVDAAVAAEMRFAAAVDPEVPVVAVAAPDELWFDYCADIGDGVAAMYSTAYLLQADLVLADGAATTLPSAAEVLAARVAENQARPGQSPPVRHALAVAPPRREPETDRELGAGAPVDPRRLPRGEFLFVGGDTAYHVADRATIAARVQAPFVWAAGDLFDRGLLSTRRRRIYGIPGNHDWYDELDGFSRIFRRSAPAEGKKRESELEAARREAARTIDLPGFDRRQYASYVGISLPWGWQLWGLDIDQPLDERQRRYFRSLCVDDPAEGRRPPARLIVCTPSPPIVFDRTSAGDAHDDAMQALGLPRLYEDTVRDNPLRVGACRLDLSGDVHHYARYPAQWDRFPADAPAEADVEDTSYQAVVSGLGGAFLHPSDTILGAHRPVAASVFPAPQVSRAETGRGTRFWTLMVGGWIRVVPLLLTLLFSWVWLQPGMARMVGDRILTWLGFDGEVGLFRHGEPTPLLPVTRAWTAAFLWKAATLLVSAVCIGAALWFWHRVTRARARGERRSYGPVTVLAGLGLASLIMAPVVVGDAWRHGLTVDALVLMLLVLMPLAAGALTPWLLGAKVEGRARWLGGLVGALHLAVQLTTMVILTRVALTTWWASALAIAGFLLANTVVTPWLCARGWSAATRGAVLLAVWLVLVGGLWWVVLAAAGGHAVVPRGAAEQAVLMLAAPALAMLLGCAHFGWYLAVMSTLGYHNNELGGAARVERFREFIRFRVTRDQLTGYVIGLDRVVGDRDTGDVLEPRLLDVFTIAPRPAAAPPDPGIYASRLS